MKQVRFFILLIVATLFLVQPVHAWNWDTHLWLSEKAIKNCQEKQLSCAWLSQRETEVLNGSLIPDAGFHDGYNHICYLAKCPALTKAEEYYKKAYYETINQPSVSATNLGIGSHYFVDSFVPVHQIKDEDYNKCHAPFESKVGERLLSNSTNWTVEQTCVLPSEVKVKFNITYSEMEQLANRLALYWDAGGIPSASEVQNKNIIYTYPTFSNNTTNISAPLFPLFFKKLPFIPNFSFSRLSPKGVFDTLLETVKSLMGKVLPLKE